MAVRTSPSARRATALLVTVLLCAPAVSGCAGSAPPAPVAAPHASHTAAHTGVTASPDGGLNATDIGWIQLMIAMDDQAWHILELAPRHGGDARLKRWAGGLAEGRRSDLAALRGLLADAGVPDDNPHEGHDMPGMVDRRELRDLETARGDRFDELLRAALREHLDQSGRMATAVRSANAGHEVKRLALTVARTSTDARRTMPPPA
ncbi:DUF305 domain-containing protein [Streptomyces sp. NPDC026672]|uniref:DUF305 domain-containing protein n=1 Tax=unclassified Streptomyces TaxID=2593676 RepID=UPI0033EA52E6